MRLRPGARTDSSWLEADSSTHTAGGGVRGKLAKSKTSGPGKKTRYREVSVSSEAYFKRANWLESGWKFWETAPKPRQNVIAVLDPTMETFRQVGAEVQDRVALTRHVLEKPDLAGGMASKPEL